MRPPTCRRSRTCGSTPHGLRPGGVLRRQGHPRPAERRAAARPEGPIAAARLNGSPNGNAIGRGMKVNKEEMVGMLAALELFVREGPRTRRARVRAARRRDPRSAAAVAGRQGRNLRSRGGQPRAARAGDVGRRVQRPGRPPSSAPCRTASPRSQSGRKERRSSSASG